MKLLEIDIKDKENFLKIKETLTRIGVGGKDNKLFQSCHILHKRCKISGVSRYYICHFKELFALDGKPSTFDEIDLARRNTIAKLLEEWKLIEIVDKDAVDKTVDLKNILVIPYSKKDDFELIQKYDL